MLAEKLSSGVIASTIGLTRPATSQHLSVLLSPDFVRVRVAGRSRFYRANHTALGALRDYLDSFWDHQLDKLASSLGDAT